jgi:hypothetical protein
LSYIQYLSSSALSSYFFKTVIVIVVRVFNWKCIFRHIQSRSIFTTLFLSMYSESSNNFWYVLSLRTHGTTVLSGSISVEKLQHFGKPQCLVFSQKVTKLIKDRGDKGRTYDVIPLNWDINNYDIYNRNGLIETIILYNYIIFI